MNRKVRVGPEVAGLQLAVGRSLTRAGQATTELAISTVFLLLLVTGMVDLSRVFYFQVSMHGAVREAARHAAWFSPGTNNNPYLDDADILTTVNQSLSGAHLTAQYPNGSSSTCPTTSNPFNNPPLPASAFPATSQLNVPYVYVCYKQAGGTYQGGPFSAPATNSYSQGDVLVILAMSYGLASGFLQNYLGNGLQVTAYAHFMIQGSGT